MIQYADDTLLVMEVDLDQLLHLKHILDLFADSTGLKVNYSKSVMVPINTPQDRLHHLADIFDCQAGPLPFTYLGLTLGLTKTTIEEFFPLIKKVERRLRGISNMLSQGGKLQLVNSVLTSTAMFHMATIKLPKGVIDQIDKYRKHCLWRGSDLNSMKPSKAAWPLVCLPKQ